MAHRVAPSAGPALTRLLLSRGGRVATVTLLTAVMLAEASSAPLAAQQGAVVAVGDVARKLLAFTTQLDETPWLRELYGFHPDVLPQLEREAADLMDEAYLRIYAEDEGVTPPRLHMKANYFATSEAWDQLLSRPEVWQPFRIYFHELAQRNLALARGDYRNFRIMADVLLPPTREILREYAAGLSPEDRSRLALFFAIGSHNQNNRSMALDGEVALVVASWSALFGLPDLIIIVGLSEWIDDLDELEALFPSYRRLKRRISRLIRIAV